MKIIYSFLFWKRSVFLIYPFVELCEEMIFIIGNSQLIFRFTVFLSAD